MWSDKLTTKAMTTEMVFDLICESDGVEVRNNLTFEEAIQLAESGGVKDARFVLESAWIDETCVELQRPGKNAEILVPHN